MNMLASAICLLLLTLANANGSLATTSNSTLALGTTANVNVNAYNCLDITYNIETMTKTEQDPSNITMVSYPLTNRNNTLKQLKSQLNILRLKLHTITSKLVHTSKIV